MNEKYDPKPIEGKWQEAWENQHVFRAVDFDSRPKYFCLCMFPYPSGAIHMGHVRNYAIGDVISRYKRMRGFNVLQPIGWDSFGLPAENAAIQRGIHPKDWTLQNISQMKTQFKAMGISYDWDREVTTCLPEYFKWEQMLFRKFYEKGLAYKKKGTVNWCESCQTVLANEQVQDGKCWRCDGAVILKDLNQWYFKITAYADQLLSGHKLLEKHWPDRVLEMQKHWIGQSEGARIQFKVDGRESLEVFTTRPDTLFGVTFVTIAPGHPMAKDLCVLDGTKETLEKLKRNVQLRPKDDQAQSKEGFQTGSFVIHPLTGEKVPICVGDFVVMEYGTGAVMGVPAHDQRDFEFAKKLSLPIKIVIQPKDKSLHELAEAYTEPGVMVHSGAFDKLDSESAKGKITEALEQKKQGVKTIQYRLRDWGVSRQRYWGAPVPVVNCATCGTVLVPEKDLPVTLPYEVSFAGQTGNPLERHPTFKKTTCPNCKGPAERETDTMDTFVESSWYYARYASPKCDTGPFDKKAADYWLPVDYYIGGIEHACMHLLYARFFHKILRDWGYLSGDEPFSRLLTQGMVIKDGAKMSKSKGNVVSPQLILDQYGADTARLFSLFAAPPEKDLDWNEKGVEGCHRFLHRVWRLFYQFREPLARAHGKPASIPAELVKIRRKAHWMIQKMTEDLDTDKFNTAISAAMELVNELYGVLATNEKGFDSDAGGFVLQEAMTALVQCLSPYAPHLCEELWREMGKKTLLSLEKWPSFDGSLLVEATFTLVIQVNGKLREKIELPKNLSKDEIQQKVMALPKLKPYVEGKTVKQFIYVPEKLANVVVV